MKNTFKTILLVLAIAFGMTSCNVDPEFYSQVVPETFYQSQDAVWQRFARPFTAWRYYAGHTEHLKFLQEIGTDELMVPTRGSDWYNGAAFQTFHHHEFSTRMWYTDNGWILAMQGVAQAWDALEDLNEIDFEKFGLTESTRESMRSQLQGLVIYYYLKTLDLFGGMPLYTSTKGEAKARSTDVETFNFIDSLCNEALPNLPVKQELGGEENGSVNAAAVAAMRAELYFNAPSYIRKEMWTECAQICQDIIDGKYGKYDLDPDWTNIFGFTNETSPEIIWSVPSQNAKLETDGTQWATMVPYNYREYLGGLENSGAWNGCALQPGLDPTGKEYTFKLGRPYTKFNDKDVRKQNYVYEGNGKYRGMFIVGRLVNPVDTTWKCYGAREYAGQVINEVDQCAYFARVRNDRYRKEDGSYMYNSVADLPSTIATGEENSGVRVTKLCPRPTENDVKLMYNPDVPIIRMAEIYYMLAECKWRQGDKAGAAQLINKVRQRYFEGGVDPDPCTADNLDKYRFLDEWMMEFLYEGRRRTDLIRWDAYVNEDWWDHKATHNENLNRFPLNDNVLNSNQLLEQNPGY